MRAVVVMLAIAGCDRWAGPDARWTLEARNRFGDSLRPTMYATAGANGDTFAAVLNVQLGDRELIAPHVVRVSPTGVIVGARPAMDIGEAVPVALGGDARGRPAVLWKGSAGVHWITAFEESLAQRWSHLAAGQTPNAPIRDGAFAVGAAGEVVYVVMDQNGAVTMRYLGEDGAERWTASPGFVEHAVIGDGGDVIAYSSGRRVRYAGGDGAVVEDIAHPGVWAAAADGSAVSVELGVGDIELHGATGALQWHAQIRGVGLCGFGGCRPSAVERSTLVSLGADGDVYLEQYQSEILRLERTSGDVAGIDEHCAPIAVVSSDVDGYVALGPTCELDYALARYAPPK